MTAQASDDNIKVVPKMKTRSSDLCPWADWSLSWFYINIIVFAVESSWSTVEMIAQTSDDNIKVVPEMKTRSSDLFPWADWR